MSNRAQTVGDYSIEALNFLQLRNTERQEGEDESDSDDDKRSLTL